MSKEITKTVVLKRTALLQPLGYAVGEETRPPNLIEAIMSDLMSFEQPRDPHQPQRPHHTSSIRGKP